MAMDKIMKLGRYQDEKIEYGSAPSENPPKKRLKSSRNELEPYLIGNLNLNKDNT